MTFRPSTEDVPGPPIYHLSRGWEGLESESRNVSLVFNISQAFLLQVRPYLDLGNVTMALVFKALGQEARYCETYLNLSTQKAEARGS